MKMPEPEEGKVTATGEGLRASGLLKLGGVRRSLLQKGLFVRFAIATTLKSLLPAPIFKQPSQHWFTLGSHVRTPVGVVNSPRVSARGLTAHAYI